MDFYEAFDNYQDALQRFEGLKLLDTTYSVSIAEVVNSTDYTPGEMWVVVWMETS